MFPACVCCYTPAKQHLSSCWLALEKEKDLEKGCRKSGDEVDLDNHFLAGVQRCYKREQIGHIFHKLLDSIEECLTWCFQFMQGIWDRIQRASSKCSISSAGSELQRKRGGTLAMDDWKDRREMANEQNMATLTERWWMDRAKDGWRYDISWSVSNFRQFTSVSSRQLKWILLHWIWFYWLYCLNWVHSYQCMHYITGWLLPITHT